MPTQETLPLVRVWDLPTRLFHWLLAVAVVGAVVSAWIGGNAMVWHMRLGLSVLALLLFRTMWGLVGGRWSRFASFAYGPGTVLRYLRGELPANARVEVGHTPPGSLSVFALLALLAVQVATGLVADDEIATVGPLNRYVTSTTGLSATSWHHAAGQWLVIGLVALHVAAIMFYRLRRKVDLVRPMLTGDKRLPAHTPASADSAGTRTLALVLAAACAGFVTWIARLGG